jgi:hypothetical protein
MAVRDAALPARLDERFASALSRLRRRQRYPLIRRCAAARGRGATEGGNGHGGVKSGHPFERLLANARRDQESARSSHPPTSPPRCAAHRRTRRNAQAQRGGGWRWTLRCEARVIRSCARQRNARGEGRDQRRARSSMTLPPSQGMPSASPGHGTRTALCEEKG